MSNSQELFKRLEIAVDRLAKTVPVDHENHLSLANARMWAAVNSGNGTKAVELFEQLVETVEKPGSPPWLTSSLIQGARRLSQVLGDTEDDAPTQQAT